MGHAVEQSGIEAWTESLGLDTYGSFSRTNLKERNIRYGSTSSEVVADGHCTA